MKFTPSETIVRFQFTAVIWVQVVHFKPWSEQDCLKTSKLVLTNLGWSVNDKKKFENLVSVSYVLRYKSVWIYIFPTKIFQCTFVQWDVRGQTKSGISSTTCCQPCSWDIFSASFNLSFQKSESNVPIEKIAIWWSSFDHRKTYRNRRVLMLGRVVWKNIVQKKIVVCGVDS